MKTVIKEKLIDFNEELKLNDLTTIIVSRKDSILTAKIDIKNQQENLLDIVQYRILLLYTYLVYK